MAGQWYNARVKPTQAPLTEQLLAELDELRRRTRVFRQPSCAQHMLLPAAERLKLSGLWVMCLRLFFPSPTLETRRER
jgi:hypothetical protein